MLLLSTLGVDLHLVLHIFGQKNLTFFPVTGSFFLHRCFGCAETHPLHSLFCSLLNRKVTLSSHSPRSLVVGADVGDALGDLVLHLVLHIFGQKNLTSFPVTGSILMHRLAGFFETHVSQFLSTSLLKRNVLLSSHSPRSLVVGADVGDALGDLVLHLVLQIFGQKYLTFFPVAGSILMHRLAGFFETHVSHCLSTSLLKRNVLLSSHFPRVSVGEVVGNADAVGDGVVAVGLNDAASIGISAGSNIVGISVGFFVGVRVGFCIGEKIGDRVFSPPFPFPLLFSLLLLFPFPFPLLL